MSGRQEAAVHGFLRKRFHCADSRNGLIVLCPSAELRHRAAVGEVLHIDFLHWGDTEGGNPVAEETDR